MTAPLRSDQTPPGWPSRLIAIVVAAAMAVTAVSAGYLVWQAPRCSIGHGELCR